MTTPLIITTSRPIQIRDRIDNSQPQKFEGLDFLRAIFAVMVVVLHANLLIVLTGKLKLNFLADILNANVGYLAVPVFFQISLFLFLLKRERVGHQYFVKKRLPKLLSLYLFWSITKLIFDWVLNGKSSAIQAGSSSVGKFVGFMIGGGYSAFYFFFSLIFLTALAELLVPLFRRMKQNNALRISYYLLFLSCILPFSFPFIDRLWGDQEVLTQIVNPLNFLPYVFTAAIAVQEFQTGRFNQRNPSLKLRMLGLLILFLVFTSLEWLLFDKFPHYSRLSLVFSSWLLLYLALMTQQKPPAIIALLSGCSLGIYGLHVFFVDHTDFLEPLSDIVPGLGPATKFLVALIGSIALTLIFRRTKFLKGFV